MQFILDHYKDILLAVIAVDSALMPLFPQVGLLGKIKDFLAGLVK